MHRIATISGGWNQSTDSVVFVDQQPAPIVIITAADTDIQTLAAATAQLPEDFPQIRVVNILQLQQQIAIDTYAEEVLGNAKVIIVRLIGGQSYWSYGLEVVKETVASTGAILIVLPGDERPDPNLTSHSTTTLTIVNQAWQYFIEAGISNYQNLLKFIAKEFLDIASEYELPQSVPRIGVYEAIVPQSSVSVLEVDPPQPPLRKGGEFSSSPFLRGIEGDLGLVAILFYRAHYLSGNTRAIAALCEALRDRNLEPLPIYVSSLKEPDVQAELIRYCLPESDRKVDVILNTTSFSLASLKTDTPQVDLWEALNVPVFQVIFSGGLKKTWANGTQGLNPRDMAMNVVLPEVDGRIITRAVSFKAMQGQNLALQTEVLTYEPVRSRINFVADLAAKWVELKQTKVGDRKIALILANYPNRDGRLANGVGLDTPASCLEILKALRSSGYSVGEIPETSDELMKLLTTGVTNDRESFGLRQVYQSLSLTDYQIYFQNLPEPVQSGISTRWNQPKQEQEFAIAGMQQPKQEQEFAIAGMQFGNIFVGIQPSRGYDLDPTLNYHAPDLEPTHDYMAFYHWVRDKFSAHAIVHIGKHGNLEWLPGKSVALSENCYPEAAFGAMPHFYPFIVNDPGEGSQAKRRSQAVILDHLTPPMTRAELYGGLQQLEGLIDEYYEAETLDPSRLGMIRDRLIDTIKQENLHQDLGISLDRLEDSLNTILTTADGYLCEIKEAQIRDGLHIFGQCPEGRQLRDLVVAIARNPTTNRMGLTRAIAQDWQLDFDPLTANLGELLETSSHPRLANCRIIGDAVEVIEEYAADLVDVLISSRSPSIPLKKGEEENSPPFTRGAGGDLNLETQTELTWIRDRLLSSLYKTNQEITNLLRGLNGEYVPSGASGAPTRGRPEVLPTGRNFYSVDIRAVPTETAWDIGRKAADVLIETYTQEHGEYPQTLGLSIWGTSTMRTGGDDLAEALALLGVQPVWDGVSRRVIDFEILPLSILGRPRVDVTLRISGFFRDAFPNLIDLFDSAVNAVANLDEPAEQNPLAAKVQAESAHWQREGLTLEQAQERSRYRIFGSKPSAYGAGLQGLLESQNWESEQDLARAYINWSAYAYTSKSEGKSAPEAFNQRLSNMQIVLQNQDNREHDILDSDDYYQFQGGMTAAIKSISGNAPEVYFGDNSRMAQPKVRKLSEEIARVYRSRVVNPKWISGAMRHGYKGAFEMSATLDYLFAYDATTNCVSDFMYEGIAEAYIFNPEVQNFIKSSNPWALRDMSERLLEANQRGMWQEVNADMLDRLKAIANDAEGAIESQTGLTD
ncbi:MULTISPECIES: cobaltochelatase subunit CobN [Pseudanabaena]|uniref:Cobaltochelatase CobN subunit n=2 Tax=Pseudanabaena TaxID=1152 RepID=L8N2W9_9CYAN|nr:MULTISPECIES: cobaltochelatase subunit CobN [Pseudanabaena]ELS33409.1 cobaltochelatase CobN subunit [Pseudanabaena biceps PCC 7429]MDG3494390.1 cobaltochelatase subunit CobN [Pseudanabaena catenata USMAC16]